jgi:hypothetical protein
VLLPGVVILFLFLILSNYRSDKYPTVKPIPGWLLPPLFNRPAEYIRYQLVSDLKPIPHQPIPQHPFMASNPGNNMHNDASMSDAYEASGPLGLNTRIISRSQGFGGYGTVAFDHAGRLVAVYSNARQFQLELMDPTTLEELASYDLPPRPWYYLAQGVMPWEYIGAGMYFYLDNLDRAVVPTTRNTVQVIQVPEPGSQEGFQLEREYDLSSHVVNLPQPQEDSVAWVLPDWGGKYFWFATTHGMVGTLSVETGQVVEKHLDGEIIENSFAVGSDGVFIISDQALYNFRLGGNGNIDTIWRTPYDPGSAKKPGVITRGSGTSVTLLGGENGMVAITDNAEPRIHLLFIERSDGSVACSLPLFEENRSATDITVIGFELADLSNEEANRYSAIVENNWGHSNFPFAHPEPGITRVDLVRQEDGFYECNEVWTSEETNIGVFKLSLGNGLLYVYFRDKSPVFTNWYFTAIDFYTGETVFKQPSGSGMGFNNWAGAIFLHPEKGIAYSTTIFGLVMMQDSVP